MPHEHHKPPRAPAPAPSRLDDGEPGGKDRDPTQSVLSDQNDDNARPKETGGRDGPEPTRFGDWEKQGRCIDF